MGKKKGKKVDEGKKAALQAKKEAKQEKSARKRLAKQQGGAATEEADEEDDFDRVLKAYKTQDKPAEHSKPTLEQIDSSFPLPRANATLDFCPEEKREHFYLFGGEYFDGVENVVLDDLMRFDVQKKEWKRILTSPGPSPRCAHSCVAYKTSLYIFGGEMATADQYHHYRDLWNFDVNKLTWTEIKAKNPPSARSGHVCFLWKSYMVLFGGFFEALRETRWYNDIHVFNFQTETWVDLPQSRLAVKPEPRSACNVASFGADKMLIHGGFSKLKSTTTGTETKVHTDAWVLLLSPILQGKPPVWERWLSSSKGVSTRSPNGRAGMSSVSYKNRMIVFGGVVDQEQMHHKVESVFFNDLIALDTERRKWFPLAIQEKKAAGGRRRRKNKDQEVDETMTDQAGTGTGSDSESEDSIEDDNDAVLSGWDVDTLRANMFAFVDGNGNVVYEKIEEEDESDKPAPDDCSPVPNANSPGEEKNEILDDKNAKPVSDSKDSTGEDRTGSSGVVSRTKIAESAVMSINPETGVAKAVDRLDPLPRINSSTLVHGHIMYLMGGILEVGDREITLDDMWSVDLKKRTKWECLWQGTMHNQVWRGAVHDDDDSYISTGKEDEDTDNEDSDNESATGENVKGRSHGVKEEIAKLNDDHNLDDHNRTPAQDETLADFYSRTSDHWNQIAAESKLDTEEVFSSKELKREGFKLAQIRYQELLPVLERMAELSIGTRNDCRREIPKQGKQKKTSRK